MSYPLLMTWTLWCQLSFSPCTLGTCQARPAEMHPPEVVQQAFATEAACQERRDALTQTFMQIDDAIVQAGGVVALAHYSRVTHRFWCMPNDERPAEVSAPHVK